MKTVILLCAAMLVMAAAGFGMYKAGWFYGQRHTHGEARRQAKAADPLQSEEAMRFRTCQNTSWRVCMNMR